MLLSEQVEGGQRDDEEARPLPERHPQQEWSEAYPRHSGEGDEGVTEDRDPGESQRGLSVAGQDALRPLLASQGLLSRGCYEL